MLNLSLTLLILLTCGVICTGLITVGVFLGFKLSSVLKGKSAKLDEKEAAEKKRVERELRNFLEYTGDNQN